MAFSEPIRPDPVEADRDPDPTRTTRPLKIGLVSDCYVPRLGGIEMQVHDLARNLQLAGHDVVVITPTPGPDIVDGVRVHRMDVPLLPFDIPFTPATFRVKEFWSTRRRSRASIDGRCAASQETALSSGRSTSTTSIGSRASAAEPV